MCILVLNISDTSRNITFIVLCYQYSFIFSRTFILFGVLHSLSHFRCFHLGIFSFYWKIPFYVPFSASLLTTVTQFFCLFENCIYSAFVFEGYILLGNQYWVDNCFLSSLWRCFFHCFLTSINSFEKPDIFCQIMSVFLWLPLSFLIFSLDSRNFSVMRQHVVFFSFILLRFLRTYRVCGLISFSSFGNFSNGMALDGFCPITLSSSYGILITHIFDTHLVCYLWYLHVLFFLHFNLYVSMTCFQVHLSCVFLWPICS